jgi:putative ATPase
MGTIRDDVQRTVAEPVPMNLRNAPTRLMKDFGYGEGYQHAHNFADAMVGMDCLPASLAGRRYYFPSDRGIEKRIAERLEEIRRIKAGRRQQPPSGGGQPE